MDRKNTESCTAEATNFLGRDHFASSRQFAFPQPVSDVFESLAVRVRHIGLPRATFPTVATSRSYSTREAGGIHIPKFRGPLLPWQVWDAERSRSYKQRFILGCNTSARKSCGASVISAGISFFNFEQRIVNWRASEFMEAILYEGRHFYVTTDTALQEEQCYES